MIKKRARKNERGTSMSEFAIVAGLFFMVIFGIIEFGRLLYTHNALTDATRRGARYAVLNPSTDINCVKAVAVYGETNIDKNTCTGIGPPLINGLDTSKVDVVYQGVTAPAVAPFGMNTGTATVSITGYTFYLSIPFIGQTLNMPAYRTTLTAESAGLVPPII